MQQAALMGVQMPVKAAYNKLINQFDVDDAPRNVAVVRNKKYRDARELREANSGVRCNTFADKIVAVFNLLQADKQLGPNSFVRYCIATGHRVPSVILYTERQLRDLRSFCFHGASGSVLGFDKTYNLGPMHVTVSVYKNIALFRRRTTEHPLFLGPLYIHGHSDADTYSFFFFAFSDSVVRPSFPPAGYWLRRRAQHT